MQIRGNIDFNVHCAGLTVHIEVQRKKCGEWPLDQNIAYYEKEEQETAKRRGIYYKKSTRLLQIISALGNIMVKKIATQYIVSM